MKRETILFSIMYNKIYIYLKNAKKEIINDIDVSFFFKCGEISDVEKFSNTIEEELNKKKILTGFLKPNICVLYNDITNSDLKYLYKVGLTPFNYEKIDFMPISNIIKMINDSDRVVWFDKNYYTIFKYGYKTKDKNNIDFAPIFIGKNNVKDTHYADNNIIWSTFISYFTKN